jgi:hypothetical protein
MTIPHDVCNLSGAVRRSFCRLPRTCISRRAYRALCTFAVVLWACLAGGCVAPVVSVSDDAGATADVHPETRDAGSGDEDAAAAVPNVGCAASGGCALCTPDTYACEGASVIDCEPDGRWYYVGTCPVACHGPGSCE